MAKNTFATLGILVVLLLGLGMTSAAATDNNFTISIDGVGESSGNPATGADGESINFTVDFTNNNANYSDVNLSWSGVDISSGTLNNTDTATISPTVDISTSSGSSHILNVFVTNSTSGESIGNLTVSVYYLDNSTVDVTGCMEEDATNYNEDATINDSSCTYASDDTFCELNDFGTETGHLEISEIDITNNGEGDDEEWEYLDEIVIEVTIENTDNENIDDVMVEILIKDDQDNTITRKDISLDQDDEDLGRIKDEDEETATFTIDELPIDLEDGDYKLYVRAYEDGNEDSECVSTSEDFTDDDETYFEFSITSSDDATVIVKKNIENVKASCGDDNVEVRFMVYNTGSDKEDKVLVNLYSLKLGIDEYTVIDSLKDGKGKEAVFYITVPDEVKSTFEKLKIYTYYDYDDDDDEELDEFAYGESSLNEGDDFSMLLEIISCQAAEPTITANLESTAQVGQDLVVKAIVKNNAEDNDFTISVSGFESWAELVSIEPQTASIDEGETQEVTITLTPTSEGTQSFKIVTLADGAESEQTVSLSIAEKKGIFGFSNNIMAYAIIGIVALLVLIFLVLMVRISKRASAPQF